MVGGEGKTMLGVGGTYDNIQSLIKPYDMLNAPKKR